LVFVVFFAATALVFGVPPRGPRFERGVSGSHAPHPVDAQRHLLHPFPTTTSAMELSARTLAFFFGALVAFFAASANFCAAGPRGSRAVPGSHAPHPFADHLHLLQPLVP
jgi:hypothetical protein